MKNVRAGVNCSIWWDLTDGRIRPADAHRSGLIERRLPRDYKGHFMTLFGIWQYFEKNNATPFLNRGSQARPNPPVAGGSAARHSPPLTQKRGALIYNVL